MGTELLAEGKPVHCQVFRLVLLFVKLKSWRFLGSIFLIFSLVSNNFFQIGHDRAKFDSRKNVLLANLSTFTRTNVILWNFQSGKNTTKEYRDALERMKNSSTNLHRICRSTRGCSVKHIELILRQPSGFYNLIRIPNSQKSTNNSPSAVCHIYYGSELFCPFLSHYALGSEWRSDLPMIKALHTFRVLDRTPYQAGFVYSHGLPLCATSAMYPVVFPNILTMQSLLAIWSFYFYCMIGCNACVSQIKSGGFLQIMIQRGLSVRAYWIAVWIIAGAEAVLFSCVSIASYTLQCHEFFQSGRVFLIFSITFLQLLGGTSLCLLYTVILHSQFYIHLSIVLTAIVTMLLVLLNRLVLDTWQWIKLPSALVPFTNHAEYQQCALLENVSPNSALVFFHHLVFIICMLVPAALILITLYLDFVLSTGNGLRLPYNFLNKLCVPNLDQLHVVKMDTLKRQDLVPNGEAQVEQVEGLTPVVYTNKLVKNFYAIHRNGVCCRRVVHSKALRSLSVTMYRGQITALLGSNSSGKSTLLNILSSRSRMNEGLAIISGQSLSDPQRLRGRLGISPPEGALYHQLTLRETMEILALSAGGYWRDYGDEAFRLLQSLGLEHLQNRPVCELSRKQRVLLCTAMALLGPTELVILDDPVNYLDDASRIMLWQALLKFKRNRSIILSTQQMNEAEVFADWLVLLSKGSLRCAGTPGFFNKVYKCGLILIIKMRSEKHIDLLLTTLNNIYSAILVLRQMGPRIQLHVPRTEAYNAEFITRLIESYSQIVQSFNLSHGTLQHAYFNRKLLIKDASKEPLDFKSSLVDLDTSEANICEEDASQSVAKSKKRRNGTKKSSANSENAKGYSAFGILSAMFVVNFKRSVRQRVRLCFKIIIPIIQLLSILGGSLIESSLRRHSQYKLAYVSPNSPPFKRGVCLEDVTQGLTLTACKNFFGQPNATSEQFIIASKRVQQDLKFWLDRASTQEFLKDHCKVAPEPCPIIYLSDWANNTTVKIGIGVYINLGKYEALTATIATVKIYKLVLRHFGVPSIGFNLHAIFDFRFVVPPLFGMYFHLPLVYTLPATFLVDLTEDATIKMRNQLRVIGIRRLKYWAVTLLTHWVQYALVYTCSSAILMVAIPRAYQCITYIQWVFLPTLLLGLLCNQLLAYNLSFLVSAKWPTVTVGYMLYTLMLFLLIHMVHTQAILSSVLLFIVPKFASVALSFFVARKIFIAMAYLPASALHKNAERELREPIVPIAIAAMGVHLMLLFTYLACTENATLLAKRLRSIGKSEFSDEESGDVVYCLLSDKDMIKYSERIAFNPQKQAHIFEVRTLTKEYENNVKAVRCVTFAVKPGEIFGLVGSNDSGKSTIVRVLTGEEQPSIGNCEFSCGEEWLKCDVACRRKIIGYCPQHNPLYEYITVREHFYFYSAALGLSAKRTEIETNKLIDKFGLKSHQSKLAVNLSSGYRRRLSIAIALLGDASVIILDDVSEGIDHAGKRLVWDAIKSSVTKERSVLITMTSLEEAECLCDRVGIMCDGYLLTVATVDQIFDTYGDAYWLHLLFLETAAKAAMESKIHSTLKRFPQATLVQRLRLRATFVVPTQAISPLSAALHWLNALKASGSVEEYLIRRLSLNDALDRLVKQKESMVVPEDMASKCSLTSSTSSV